MEGKKGSKTFFRVLEFLSKIPNIKQISNEHFNLREADIALNQIIKFRCNNNILKQIINLQLMMSLQKNFKRVLLNCASSSIHLHPPHLNLQPAVCNILNVIRTKISHIIGQFSKIWVEKFKVVHFDRKLAQMVFWRWQFQIWT